MSVQTGSPEERLRSPDSLLSTLPDVRRARGWRLYAADGTRIISLWSDYGRNLLGYTPRGLAGHAKSAIDRGLVAPVAGSWNGRIVRMVRRIFPEYGTVRLLRDAETSPGLEHARFLFDSYLPQSMSQDRDAPMRIVLPIPAALSPGILAAATAAPLRSFEDEPVEGLRGASAIFALSLMASEKTSGALSARFENAWQRFDGCGFKLFRRAGPWLMPNYPREAQRELFAFCASRGALISPEYDFPSSVPGDFDEGELSCLHEAASAFL